VTQATGWADHRVAPIADTLAEGGLGLGADAAAANRPTRLGRLPTPRGPAGAGPASAGPAIAAPSGAGTTASRSTGSTGPGRGTAVPHGRAGSPARTGNPAQLAAEVVALVNARRAAGRCAPVRTDRRLQQAAHRHSSDMAARRSLDARSASGEAPWEQAWAQGYYFYAGQAIERGQQDAAGVVDAWMRERQSRSVLLDCGSTVVGVAVHRSRTGPWWTAIFGYGTDGR